MFNKKISLIVAVTLGLTMAQTSALAGMGWYVTVQNNSSQPVLLAPQDSEHCWISKELGVQQTVGAMTQKTFYTEQDQSFGRCSLAAFWYFRFTINSQNTNYDYTLYNNGHHQCEVQQFTKNGRIDTGISSGDNVCPNSNIGRAAQDVCFTINPDGQPTVAGGKC